MNLSRNSVAGWSFATALVARGLAPLANLTDGAMIALIYAKFAMLVVATFLARFCRGPSAAWWFGFATLGWASMLFCMPDLWNWNGVGAVEVAPGVYLDDMIYARVVSALELPDTGRIAKMVELIVSTWITILASTSGGYVALLLDRKARRSAAADASEPTPSR
jgi:hypothetical protein